MRTWSAIFLLVLAAPASAQVGGYGRSTAPVIGGVGVAPQPASPFRSLEGTFAPNHKTPDGKLCISVHPSTQSQIVNPKVVDQIVLIQNICGQTIRVQVCYAGSSDCIQVSLGSYQKVQRILGIASGARSFRYEYRELS
jgi:hypothetical protein